MNSDSILTLHYTVVPDDFSRAGEASSDVKNTLKHLRVSPDIIRRVAIALYEGEINMVIHAQGGTIDVNLTPNQIIMVLKDSGPGIEDIDKAMEEGYSTASASARSLGFGAGMGLPNIKKCSDDMNIETVLDVGTTLTIAINLSNE
ncbi:ATP-binding protein [Clostridium aminobutyricum]|uniref:ATP-binding protein n=1 Tax=Clostridium aminobutyricum TaxID=33953 RepID=A0A939D6P5_CLOAM|nr:ATP-binding protein [Clostridium aminobutyricum]MBN7772070.1 ATP-binding protein [Clostridium aminobutyricum]